MRHAATVEFARNITSPVVPVNLNEKALSGVAAPVVDGGLRFRVTVGPRKILSYLCDFAK